MAKVGLTDRQEQVLALLCGGYDDGGFPTATEIAQQVDVGTETTRDHLKRLVDKGYCLKDGHGRFIPLRRPNGDPWQSRPELLEKTKRQAAEIDELNQRVRRLEARLVKLTEAYADVVA